MTNHISFLKVCNEVLAYFPRNYCQIQYCKIVIVYVIVLSITFRLLTHFQLFLHGIRRQSNFILFISIVRFLIIVYWKHFLSPPHCHRIRVEIHSHIHTRICFWTFYSTCQCDYLEASITQFWFLWLGSMFGSDKM